MPRSRRGDRAGEQVAHAGALEAEQRAERGGQLGCFDAVDLDLLQAFGQRGTDCLAPALRLAFDHRDRREPWPWVVTWGWSPLCVVGSVALRGVVLLGQHDFF